MSSSQRFCNPESLQLLILSIGGEHTSNGRDSNSDRQEAAAKAQLILSPAEWRSFEYTTMYENLKKRETNNTS